MKKTNTDLVPDIQNPTPDYYCTWQTQLYATNDGKPEGQRAIIGEKALFDKEKPYGWAYFYEHARKDLFIVMDDSWDVPLSGDFSYCGSLVLDKGKFPSFVNGSVDNTEAMQKLSERIKSLGWRGLGGWVCAQESSVFNEEQSPEEYWKNKLIEANEAGISYWKVDWGNKAHSFEFRKMLTDLARIHAPNLIIEHAMINDIIPFSDTFRTYDVPAIMSIPMTMEKISYFTSVGEPIEGNMCLLNCEDEAYISAACGFSMGIMRHPHSGAFVNGKKDMSFPEVHRNLKTKICEITRAVNWHKIAPAYAFDGKDLNVSETTLCDTWSFENIEEEIEAWWLGNPAICGEIKDNILTKKAPAIISRNTELPTAIPDDEGNIPFIVAAQNPNGTYSVATLGRTMGRKYHIPKCDITVSSGNSELIGVFGEYNNLIIKTDITDVKSVLIQDLADDNSYDITELVTIEKGKVVIRGSLISKVGTLSQPQNDTSEPGVVICLKN